MSKVRGRVIPPAVPEVDREAVVAAAGQRVKTTATVRSTEHHHSAEHCREPLAQVLHEVWLAVHVRRFDAQNDPTVPMDSFYVGINRAERAIGEVAEQYGIDYHKLRNPDWQMHTK